jgi:hypothetical protein
MTLSHPNQYLARDVKGKPATLRLRIEKTEELQAPSASRFRIKSRDEPAKAVAPDMTTRIWAYFPEERSPTLPRFPPVRRSAFPASSGVATLPTGTDCG